MGDEKPKKESKAQPRGSWAVLDEQSQVVVIESSALKALWAAQPLKGRVILWPYGATRDDVLKAATGQVS